MKMRGRLSAHDHTGSAIATDQTYSGLRSSKTATSRAEGAMTARRRDRANLSYFSEALTAA
jgi:hypothetical protein